MFKFISTILSFCFHLKFERHLQNPEQCNKIYLCVR